MKRKYLTVMLLAASAVLVTAGIILGQYRDVFSKAIKICLECVGIG